jgi:hypothetical protein
MQGEAVERKKRTCLLSTELGHHVKLCNLILFDTHGHYDPVFLDDHVEECCTLLEMTTSFFVAKLLLAAG